MRENEDIITFRSFMVACERSLGFFPTKGLVSGRIDRKARLEPYFFTFIMKNFKIWFMAILKNAFKSNFKLLTYFHITKPRCVISTKLNCLKQFIYKLVVPVPG